MRLRKWSRRNYCSLIVMPKPITILNRRRMAYTTFDVPYAVISITTPGDDEAAIAPSDNCLSVLRLSFYDIRASECCREWQTFLPEHARSIWTFVDEYWGKSRNWSSIVMRARVAVPEWQRL